MVYVQVKNAALFLLIGFSLATWMDAQHEVEVGSSVCRRYHRGSMPASKNAHAPVLLEDGIDADGCPVDRASLLL